MKDIEKKPKLKKAKSKPKEFEGVFESKHGGYGFVKPNDPNTPHVYISEFDTKGAINKERVVCKIFNQSYNLASPDGAIVRVLEEPPKIFIGSLRYTHSEIYFFADDKLCPHIAVAPRDTMGAKDRYKVAVKVISRKEQNGSWRYTGSVIQVFGDPEAPRVADSCVIGEFQVPVEFSQAALTEAALTETSVSLEEAAKRPRSEGIIVTIDGEDTKDVDDAVSLRVCENGNFLLGVYIADVAHYVREKSALDTDALCRGTSIYLCDTVIPMLPVELSNGICSLNEGVDRLALSCVMEIDPAGDVVRYEIAETVIRVSKRLTYPAVAQMLTTQEGDAELLAVLSDMDRLRQILRQKRLSRGSLFFDIPEPKITVDRDGYPTDIRLDPRLVSAEMIEEFMLVCNETIAKEYFSQNAPFVYRVHEKPDDEKLSKLGKFVGRFGYRFRGGKIGSAELQDLLRRVAGKEIEFVVSNAILRSLKPAKYSPINSGHFGLAATFYCHFTSPIRRYPDLQVHRIIKERLRGMEVHRAEELAALTPTVSQECSACERRAEDLERAFIQLKKVQFMQDEIDEVFDGVISGVTSWGIFIMLPNSVEGMINIRSLGDSFELDDLGMKLKGMYSGAVYSIGDAVRVRLESANVNARKLTFVMETLRKKRTTLAK